MFGVSAAIRRGLPTIPVPIVTWYNAVGAFTHTFNAASVSAEVWVLGGGAGGGRSPNNNYTMWGGCAGSWVTRSFDITAPTADVVVGEGGARGNSNGAWGSSGQSSSYSDGTEVVTAGGGTNSQSTGGTASGGDVNVLGGGNPEQDSAPVDTINNGSAGFFGNARSRTDTATDQPHGAGGSAAQAGQGDSSRGGRGLVLIVEWSA